MGRVILILSPHLDDAALSSPAFIQRMVRHGTEVRVATVFSEGDPALHRARRAEDRRALRVLGAKPIHIGFLDAPFRSAKYHDFCTILFGRAREYSATLRQVIDAVGELAARLGPQWILAPLAAGNHVDHRLVRDAALAAIDRSQLLWYEDRPYSFVRDQVEHVLGSRRKKNWSRYFAATYVQQFRRNTPEKRIIACWASVPAFPAQLVPAVNTIPRRDELMKTLAALACYPSQMPNLFHDAREQSALYASAPEQLYRL